MTPTERSASPFPEAAFKRLSEAGARAALYIDFEGGQDEPPVLLGILGRRGRGAEPNVFQVVLDPEFEPAGPESRGLREAVEIVVLRRTRRSPDRLVEPARPRRGPHAA